MKFVVSSGDVHGGCVSVYGGCVSVDVYGGCVCLFTLTPSHHFTPPLPTHRFPRTRSHLPIPTFPFPPSRSTFRFTHSCSHIPVHFLKYWKISICLHFENVHSLKIQLNKPTHIQQTHTKLKSQNTQITFPENAKHTNTLHKNHTTTALNGELLLKQNYFSNVKRPAFVNNVFRNVRQHVVTFFLNNFTFASPKLKVFFREKFRFLWWR